MTDSPLLNYLYQSVLKLDNCLNHVVTSRLGWPVMPKFAWTCHKLSLDAVLWCLYVLACLCVHMFICVVYTQSTCPFQMHQASVGSQQFLLFIVSERCMIYCDRHPICVLENGEFSVQRLNFREKFICICVKSAMS